MNSHLLRPLRTQLILLMIISAKFLPIIHWEFDILLQFFLQSKLHLFFEKLNNLTQSMHIQQILITLTFTTRNNKFIFLSKIKQDLYPT